MIMKSVNKSVAVEPFPNVSLEKVTNNAFARAKQKVELTGLKVIFSSDEYAAGDIVYVRGDLSKHPNIAGEIFELEGQRFILMPKDHIQLVKRGPPPSVG